MTVLATNPATKDPNYSPTHHPHHPHHHPHHHNPRTPSMEGCAEPEDLQEQMQHLHSSQAQSPMHDTFYMLPFLREAAANQTRVHQFNLDGLNRSAVFHGSPSCPEKRGDDPCPVYHVINSDPNRYPRVLLEAQCRCRFCQGIKQRREHNEKRKVPSCEKLYYYVRVLRRLPHCIDHVYQYAQSWEKLQVGCSCQLIPVH